MNKSSKKLIELALAKINAYDTYPVYQAMEKIMTDRGVERIIMVEVLRIFQDTSFTVKKTLVEAKELLKVVLEDAEKPEK